MDYRKQITAYLEEHRQELIDDICTMVRIKSDKMSAEPGKPYGEGPAAALEAALGIAKRMGFSVKNYQNYVGAIDFGGNEPALDILAHLDVVPAGNNWTVTEPFSPLVDGDRIYGRGTSDNKGPAMAALYAVRAIRDLDIPLSKRVRILLGTDEECGSSDIEQYYQMEQEAPMTFSPDASFPLINTEKGGVDADFFASFPENSLLPRICSVKSGVKFNVIPDTADAVAEGFLQEELVRFCEEAAKQTGIRYTLAKDGACISIHAEGVGGHASSPASGNNALTGMLTLLASLPCADSEGFRRLKAAAALFPHGDGSGTAAGIAMEDEISGKLTISLDIFSYSLTDLRGTFDCRSPLCATNENLRDVLKKNLAANGLELEDCEVLAAHHVPGDSNFVQTLLRCYEEVSGKEGFCVSMGGRTYVHNLKNGVAFGCGDPEVDTHAHGANEFVDIPQLLLGAEIFALAIIELCK